MLPSVPCKGDFPRGRGTPQKAFDHRNSIANALLRPTQPIRSEIRSSRGIRSFRNPSSIIVFDKCVESERNIFSVASYATESRRAHGFTVSQRQPRNAIVPLGLCIPRPIQRLELVSCSHDGALVHQHRLRGPAVGSRWRRLLVDWLSARQLGSGRMRPVQPDRESSREVSGWQQI